MPVYNLGAINTAALTAPDLYVQKVPPQTLFINGVPTDILGLVGVGSWGPVNSAILADSSTFGPVTVRKYDLASALSISAMVGANDVRAVRVTDGTDAAAAANLVDTAGSPVTGAILTAFYTGIVGNTLSAAITAGTQANTFKLTINRPTFTPEVFDNIGGSGATFWNNLVSAVNTGQTGFRGPSQLVVATRGSSTGTPNTSAGVTLSGGLDGVSSVTDSTLVGADGVTSASRTGMYALRGSGAQVLNLIDLTTGGQWPTMTAFANSEGMYAVTQGAAGNSYSTVSTTLGSAGVDDPSLKVLVGDWEYWQDNVNGVTRLMAPATFVAAEIAALSPHLSPLNKPLPGVIGTQRTSQNQPYSISEIGATATSRLDVVTNPCPGGNFYGCRTGRNTSSDPTRNGDNYTRMTNFLALTIAASFGFVIGQPQTVDLRRKAVAATDAFLAGLADPARSGGQMVGDVNGGPAFSVQCDAANNSDSQVALGYMHMKVQVKYLSIVWFFLVDLEGGQTVTVQQIGAQPALS
jgi:hypothetical protein